MGLGAKTWTLPINNIGLDLVQSDPIYDFKNQLDDGNDNIDNDSPYNNIGHNCQYYNQDEFVDKTKHLKGSKFSTFSYNIRSLPGKWSEFSQLVNTLNNNSFKFSVIAIQEVWNVAPGVSYELSGYKKFEYSIRDKTGLKSNAGGGVGYWVDDQQNK